MGNQQFQEEILRNVKDQCHSTVKNSLDEHLKKHKKDLGSREEAAETLMIKELLQLLGKVMVPQNAELMRKYQSNEILEAIKTQSEQQQR
jgi:ribosomal protein S15P/S13E